MSVDVSSVLDHLVGSQSLTDAEKTLVKKHKAIQKKYVEKVEAEINRIIKECAELEAGEFIELIKEHDKGACDTCVGCELENDTSGNCKNYVRKEASCD